MVKFWIYFIYSKNDRIKSDRLRAIYVSVTRCNLVQDLIANETRRDKAHRRHVATIRFHSGLYVFHFRGISNQTTLD